MEEYAKFASKKENKPGASFSVSKSLLDSKSKDEILVRILRLDSESILYM